MLKENIELTPVVDTILPAVCSVAFTAAGTMMLFFPASVEKWRRSRAHSAWGSPAIEKIGYAVFGLSSLAVGLLLAYIAFGGNK